MFRVSSFSVWGVGVLCTLHTLHSPHSLYCVCIGFSLYTVSLLSTLYTVSPLYTLYYTLHVSTPQTRKQREKPKGRFPIVCGRVSIVHNNTPLQLFVSRYIHCYYTLYTIHYPVYYKYRSILFIIDLNFSFLYSTFLPVFIFSSVGYYLIIIGKIFSLFVDSFHNNIF